MRVCFLADAGSVNTRNWVNAFAQDLGHEVHVVSVNRTGQFAPPVVLHHLGTETGTQDPLGKLGYIRNIRRIRRIVQKVSPDILVGYRVVSYGYVGARTGFRPLVVVPQCRDMIPPRRSLHSLPRRMLAVTAIREASLLHAWASHIADRLVELGADPEKILTCPRGIDLRKFSRPSEGASAEFTVVSTRGLRSHYGVDIVLRASRLASEKLGNVPTAVAGAGEAESELKELVRDLGTATDVWFAGEIPNEELPSLLRRSDVYVSAVRNDGVSASLLEAMACGCFPIVTDNAANRLWVDDGINGFLIAAPDPEMFAAAIVRAMGDPALRLRAQDANRAIVERRADIRVNMRTISDAYHKLVVSD